MMEELTALMTSIEPLPFKKYTKARKSLSRMLSVDEGFSGKEMHKTVDRLARYEKLLKAKKKKK